MSQMQHTGQSHQPSQITDSQHPQQSVQGQQSPGQQGVGQQGGGQEGATGQLFPTKNFLSQDVRTASITALHQCLADLTTVSMQLKTAHWNVRGPNFYQLHELFEDIVEEIEPLVDTVAERATALGGQAPGTPSAVAQRANVPRLSPTLSDEQQLLDQLSNSLATLDATLYEQINRVSERGDLDTADLLNEVSRVVSKSLWFVESHLQPGGIAQQQAQTGQAGVQAQQQFRG